MVIPLQMIELEFKMRFPDSKTRSHKNKEANEKGNRKEQRQECSGLVVAGGRRIA